MNADLLAPSVSVFYLRGRSVRRPSTLHCRRHCRKMATMMRCLCWTVPQRVIMTMALLPEKVVQ